MTQEQKDLVLRDLCGRLPHGVKAVVIKEGEYKNKRGIIESIGTSFVPLVTPHDDVLLHFFDKNYTLGNPKTDVICFSTDEIKPFLRPMSSMTEEERKEYDVFCTMNYLGIDEETASGFINWLNKHHFDYRGLIEKGLALEAAKGMYNND